MARKHKLAQNKSHTTRHSNCEVELESSAPGLLTVNKREEANRGQSCDSKGCSREQPSSLHYRLKFIYKRSMLHSKWNKQRGNSVAGGVKDMLSARRCSHLEDSFRWEARRRQCRYTARGWMKASRLSNVRPTFTCSHTRRERGEFRDEGTRRKRRRGRGRSRISAVIGFKVVPSDRTHI